MARMSGLARCRSAHPGLPLAVIARPGAGVASENPQDLTAGARLSLPRCPMPRGGQFGQLCGGNALDQAIAKLARDLNRRA